MRRLDAVEALSVGSGALEAGALFDIGSRTLTGSLEYQHRIGRDLSAVAGAAVRVAPELDPVGEIYGGLRLRF